jgi:propanol-preferring alcohol dehydrogenase
MKAAVLHKIGVPFQMEDVPVPQPGPDEVLVETCTCGICRTDIHIQDGLAYIPDFPHVPGHEPAGVIAALGERVTGLKVGERVVPHLFLTCGACEYCRTGRDAQCSSVKGVLGVTCHGGFAQFFKAPARNLLPLPENVPFETGGLVSCAVITAVHAYRRVRLSANDVAVVLGVGGIGQILVELLRHAGARIVAASRAKASLELAQKLGAHLTVSLSDPNATEKIKEFSGGEGAHCIFECVGTAATMKVAASFARRGGQIIVIGEEPDFPEIDTIQIAQRELEIIGSRNGSRQDAADALGMMGSGIIKPSVVAHYPLDGLNDAIQFMRSGKAHGRLVVTVKDGK